MPSLTNAYDLVPYPGRAYEQTHPDRMAVMGVLNGMKPTAVECCRVLEIGCGDGSNLIPMGFELPGSEFVGVDLAGKPIERARALINRLGIVNVSVHQTDLSEIGANLGAFDYIIAHGVYAWVAEPVQSQLMTVCSRNLNANGIAFISYNVYPGAQIRQILRDMMLFHARRCETPDALVSEGKSFLGLLLEANEDGEDPWHRMLKDELERMNERDEQVIYHDELAPNYSPTYFSVFNERARRHGLQFLSEARLVDMLDPQIKPEALQGLRELAGGDPIRYQQYIDFARFRKFRQTLLCHEEQSLEPQNFLQHIRELRVASPLRSSSSQPDGVVEFTKARGSGTIKTNNPVTIAFLQILEGIWPHAADFRDLVRTLVGRFPGASPGEIADEVAGAALRLSATTLIDLRTSRIQATNHVNEHPKASLLARVESETTNIVTTLLHTQMKVEDEQGREFLKLLDGTRDRSALVDAVHRAYPCETRDGVARRVDLNLDHLCRCGLLVA